MDAPAVTEARRRLAEAEVAGRRHAAERGEDVTGADLLFYLVSRARDGDGEAFALARCR